MAQKRKYISGGIVRGTPRAEAHAFRMYEEFRNRRTDYLNVAKNTGFSIEQVQIVKNYLFKDYHYLHGSTMVSRFDESFEIAESWRRLAERGGRYIQYHDTLLIPHELYEIHLLIMNTGMSQNTAHKQASLVYPYDAESERYYRERGQ